MGWLNPATAIGLGQAGSGEWCQRRLLLGIARRFVRSDSALKPQRSRSISRHRQGGKPLASARVRSTPRRCCAAAGGWILTCGGARSGSPARGHWPPARHWPSSAATARRAHSLARGVLHHGRPGRTGRQASEDRQRRAAILAAAAGLAINRRHTPWRQPGRTTGRCH